MKKLKAFLLFLLGVIVGAGGCVLVYFLTVGDVAWKQYVQDKLIPNMVFILTSIGAIYVAVSPIIKRVTASTSLFDKATDRVNTTVKNGDEANVKIDCAVKEMSEIAKEMQVQMNEMVKAQTERVREIEQSTQNTEEILRIGFGNMDELVKKGYAREIAKVGDEDEKTEN